MFFVSTMNEALSKTAHNSKQLIASKIKVIKKCCLKLSISIEKKTQKDFIDSNNFWHKKLALKVRFWYFLMNCHSSFSQNIVILLSMLIFCKIMLLIITPLSNKFHNRIDTIWLILYALPVIQCTVENCDFYFENHI